MSSTKLAEHGTAPDSGQPANLTSWKRFSLLAAGEFDSFSAPTHPMRTALTAVVSLFMALAVAMASAQAPKLSDAPKPIQELASSIQGKTSREVRTAIIARLGPPQRDIGSGHRIEQWETEGGVLTFHPATGPTFSDKKAKTYFRLLQTNNPAAVNILGSYEMTTLQNPVNRTKYWLGNVEFGPNFTYLFTDSGQHRGHRAAQTDNFFMLNPTGTVEVQYVHPITPDTRLESVPENAIIAHLVLTSADQKNRATFAITCSERLRELVFTADKPLSFHLESSWKNFWR